MMILLQLLLTLLTTLQEESQAYTSHTKQQRQSRTRLEALGGLTTTETAKNVGGGVPLLSPGNNSVFDPEEEGMLQGTGVISARIEAGAKFVYVKQQVTSSSSSSSVISNADKSVVPEGEDAEITDCQHWLEHLDTSVDNKRIDPPLNFAKPRDPVTATVLGQAKIIGDDAPGDIRHVLMKLPAGFHYVEGQSLSVIPPGTDDRGKPHKPRLYSIASTRYGDLLDGNTVSLCVRRALFYDENGVEDPSKQGVCSNFLCDTKAGDLIQVAGPVGKTMLLPEDPNQDVIMVATGTGIAPFRGFMHRLFMENTVARHMFTGKAWLILGVPVTSGLLYKDEFDAMLANAGSDALRVDYAISREMKNSSGGKMYVQDVIAQNADEIFHRLDNGACMYFCGLKGMMPSILETLEKVADERGIDWEQKMSELKNKHQWHVEVY